MKLIRITPPTSEYPILKSTSVIGRSPEADIVISGGKISEKHAAIWRIGENYSISAWNTECDVTINGIPAQSGQILWENDELIIAGIRLKFVADHVTIEAASTQVSTHPATIDTLAHLLADSEIEAIRNIDRKWRTMHHSARLRAMALYGDLPKAQIMSRWWAFTDWRRSKKTMYPTHKMGLHFSRRSQSQIIVDSAGTAKFFQHDEVSMVSAWVFQCVKMLFSYHAILENEWLERSFFNWFYNGVVEAVLSRWENDAPQRKRKQREYWYQHQETIAQEIENALNEYGVFSFEQQWLKNAPLEKPAYLPHISFARYRRDKFLNTIIKMGKRIPRQIGIHIWSEYYDATAKKKHGFLEKYDVFSKISTNLPEEESWWQAKIALTVQNSVYFFDLVKHDERGRLLVFVPGKPDDVGEPLALITDNSEKWVDQKGRIVIINRDGSVKIQTGNSSIQKILRPVSAREIKTRVVQILRERDIFPGIPKHELSTLPAMRSNVPLVLHLREQLLFPSEMNRIEHPPIEIILTTEKTRFLFNGAKFDASLGSLVSQHLVSGSREAWPTLRSLAVRAKTVHPPVLMMKTIIPEPPKLMARRAEIGNMQQIQEICDHLAQFGISVAPSGLISAFHSVFWQRHPTPEDKIAPYTMIYPETTSTTVNEFTPYLLKQNLLGLAEALRNNDASTIVKKLRQTIAFETMVSKWANGRYPLLFLAKPFLETLDNPESGMRMLPPHPLPVKAFRQCEEVLWFWGEHHVTPEVENLTFDNFSLLPRAMAWNITFGGQGRVVVSLNDRRTGVRSALLKGDVAFAEKQTEALLIKYVTELRRFFDTLAELKEA